MIYTGNSSSAFTLRRLTESGSDSSQVGKLMKLDNVHLEDFSRLLLRHCTRDTFRTRPAVSSTADKW